MANLKRQRGLSLVGFILIATVAAFVLFTGFRCVPAWTEYFSLKKVLQATANDFSATAQGAAIRSAFDRRAGVDDLPVKGTDLDISKEGGRLALSITYQRRVPVAGNVSLLFDFSAAATSER